MSVHTTSNNTSLTKVLPVIFGFFIMGFVDLIGTAINYVKVDFSLNDSTANLLALSCFFWFLVLSIPTGFLMNRIGRKNTVLLSFLFTFVGLLIPWIVYNFAFVLIAFALIGIGNTLIQVALNPLVSNVVAKEKLTGSLTLGQFIKALSSWLGPNVAAWLTASTLGWKFVFPVFALVSLLAALWLWTTHIREETGDRKEISFAATFSLLKNRKILLFFIGILVLVGVDVGLNATLPKYLMEKCPASVTDVSQADQLKSYFYFIVRALGAFAGGILLMKVPERKFYTFSALLTLAGLAGLLVSNAQWSILASVVVIALGYSNLFAIIFSQALKELPEKANEISSLLIVGVSGGIIAQLLGVVSDLFHTQWAAIAILAVIWLYMVGLIRTINKS
ncbi:MAG: MFS transporter [Tannerellaceae bacterium]|jgi:fucose permease|nr:MFS transporter [Tannerellaceae bacterium]